MEAGIPEPDRPGAGKADPVARRPKQWMSRIRWRQLRDMRRHLRADRLPQCDHDRVDTHENIAVGLGAAAKRLFERLTRQGMERAQERRQLIERRKIVGHVEHAIKFGIAFEPLPAFRIALAPGDRGIGPEHHRVGSRKPRLDRSGGLGGAGGAKQMAHPAGLERRIFPLRERLEQAVGDFDIPHFGVNHRFVGAEQLLLAENRPAFANDRQRLVPLFGMEERRILFAPQVERLRKSAARLVKPAGEGLALAFHPAELGQHHLAIAPGRRPAKDFFQSGDCGRDFAIGDQGHGQFLDHLRIAGGQYQRPPEIIERIEPSLIFGAGQRAGRIGGAGIEVDRALQRWNGELALIEPAPDQAVDMPQAVIGGIVERPLDFREHGRRLPRLPRLGGAAEKLFAGGPADLYLMIRHGASLALLSRFRNRRRWPR